MARYQWRLAIASLVILIAPGAYAGDVWTQIGPSTNVIWDIAIHPSSPSTVYAATIDGVYVSSDGASTWTRKWGTSGVSILGTPMSLLIDATNPSTVYAGCTNGYIYKTTN